MFPDRITHPPKVCVLLAAFNGAEFIRDQLASILWQRDVETDIFISIDTSTDSTEHICEQFAQEFVNVKIVTRNGRFGSAGRNFFSLLKDVDLSAFDYIALADQDDVWGSLKLDKAIKKLRHTNSKGYSSNVLAFWSDLRTRIIFKDQPQKKYDFLFEAAGPGCTYVMDAESLECFQDFLRTRWTEANMIVSHDWLIYAYFRHHHLAWVIDSQVSIAYRQHAQNAVGVNKGWAALVRRFQQVRSGLYHNQHRLICEILGIRPFTTVDILRNFNAVRRKRLDRLFLVIFSLLGFFNVMDDLQKKYER